MYQLDFDAANLRSSSNEIDMPSGEIFESLAKEYQFHVNNRQVAASIHIN